MCQNVTIPEFNKCDFYSTSYILLCCMHLGRDWLSTRSAVHGATFLNEFAPYTMQAPPLKRPTQQRFTEFDYKVMNVRGMMGQGIWIKV